MSLAAEEPAPGALLSVSEVSKRFGTDWALRDVTIDIDQGDSLVLIGGSGSGKTLLIKSIVGLESPTSGSVFVDGQDTEEMSGKERAAFERRFGMLFQRQGLFDSMTVWENVAFRLLQNRSLTKSQAREIADDKLASVGLDGAVGDLYPSEISGGMQKRVGFARAIATDPDILFLDEPTAGLDPIISHVINDIIIEGVEKLGATTISITSDMVGARRISNRIAMMHEGRMIWQGPTGDIDESGVPEVDEFIHSNIQVFQD